MQIAQNWFEPNPKDSQDKIQRANQLIAETAGIEQFQRSWHELNLWNATLFYNRELVGFHWGVISNTTRELWPTNLHSENIIQQIGSSMESKACQSPLKPTPVPHGNSWKTERAVRLLDQFLFGVWKQTNSEEACVRAFVDAYISGMGCVHVDYDDDTGELCVDPVFFDNVIVDNRECMNRQMPRTVRIRRVLPRASIEAAYDIQFDSQKTEKYVDYRQIGEGYEVVVTAWRLPNRLGIGGYMMTACNGHVLEEGEWKHDWFPLEFFHWKDRLNGFLVPSGVEELVPYQVRMNELNEAITESQDIACRPRMKIHANAQIDVSQWDNVAGRFLMWSGSEPEPLVWPTNLNDLYQERDRTYAKAYSHAGQSEMTANADLPPGVRLDSSAGVREFRNMEDSRHLRLWTRFEDFRLRVAKCIMRVLGTHEEAKAYKAVYHPPRSYTGAKTIQYKAVKTLNEDQFSWTMDAAPMSMQSPAARRELIRDAASRGAISPDLAKYLMAAPNLEWIERLETASLDDVHRHIELMEDGKYEEPTELTNLTYGILAVNANMHRLRNYEDVPPEVIESHIQWLARAISIQQMATPQPQPLPFAPTQGMPGTSAALAPHTMVNNYGAAPQQ